MGTFEFDGEKYKKASKHQKEWGNKLIAELQLKGDESVLDLGCGDGVLTEQISELVPNGSVIGIDASMGMIQTARQHVRDNLQFAQADINQMHYSSVFDVIFSNAALHWIKDHEQLLQNAYRALKSNGMIAWNFAGSGTCTNFFEVIRKIMHHDRFTEYFYHFEWPWYMPSKTEYEKLVQPIGFSNVTIIEENTDRYFANADEMIQWIDQPSLVPFIMRVPDKNKEEFRNEVIDAMLQRTLQPDGTCFETFRRIKVYASK